MLGPMQVLDVAICHATQRHHDDTSMHGPIRYTFYQRAIREQEGPTELLPPCYLADARGRVAFLPESGWSLPQ